jgi:Tol biopolymer transport system component
VASPDGGTIAFASSRSGVSRIWIKQLASGDEVALTDGDDTQPCFSPDGSQNLFLRDDRESGSLWRVSVVGGQARRVVRNATEGVWSPDGEQIAFLRLSENFRDGEVWLAAPDGSGERRLHGQQGVLRWLSWSPDGTQLLVAGAPLANAATYFLLVPANGDSVKRVTPASGLARTSNPVWFGSSERIAYAIIEARATSATGQASRIVEHSLRTGEVRDLLSIPSNCRDLAVLGDGKLLLGLAQVSQNLVLVDRPGTPQARERWLTRGAASDRQPTFSPDGRRILFSSNRSGNLDLWEVEVETGALTRITDHAAQDWDPAYTPDGNHILWSSDRSGVFEIWHAAADGSGARQISNDGVDAENPTMSADGAWILYLSGRSPNAGAWKMRADGSDPTPLVAGVNLPDISPTGDLFAAPTGAGQRTGRELRLFKFNDGSQVGSSIILPGSAAIGLGLGRPRWMGPGRIAYTDRDDEGNIGIAVRDIKGSEIGPPRKLAGFDPLAPTESFGTSRDGTRVVLSLVSSVQSIAIAENVNGVDGGSR